MLEAHITAQEQFKQTGHESLQADADTALRWAMAFEIARLTVADRTYEGVALETALVAMGLRLKAPKLPVMTDTAMRGASVDTHVKGILQNNVLGGRTTNCGFVAVAEATGLSVRDVARQTPYIKMGGTETSGVLDMLRNVGVNSTLMRGFGRAGLSPGNRAIGSIAEAEFLMKGYPEGSKFIVLFDHPGAAARSGHALNAEVVNGRLVYTDKSFLGFGTGRGWVPRAAENVDVVIVGGGR
jgi:hypothetical protein